MTNDEIVVLERRLDQIVNSDGPGDDDIERDVKLALNLIRELRTENRLLHRSYNELYEKVYGPNVKPIYAHV